MEEVIIFLSKHEMLKVVSNNEIKRIQISDRNLLLVRSGDKGFLVEPYCPHMDYPLIEGVVNPFEEIVCPWHSYRFHLGSGAETQSRCKSLKSYPIYEKEGKMMAKI